MLERTHTRVGTWEGRKMCDGDNCWACISRTLTEGLSGAAIQRACVVWRSPRPGFFVHAASFCCVAGTPSSTWKPACSRHADGNKQRVCPMQACVRLIAQAGGGCHVQQRLARSTDTDTDRHSPVPTQAITQEGAAAPAAQTHQAAAPPGRATPTCWLLQRQGRRHVSITPGGCWTMR